MAKKVVCLLLICFGELPRNSFSMENASNGALGYEILEHRFDNLQLCLVELVKKLTHVLETSEIKLDTLLDGISAISNASNQILQQQAKLPRNVINSCLNAIDSGLYQLKLSTKSFPVSVYCDMESFLGGWLVIQQRTDGSVNFIRNWREYQRGFGTVDESGEFWLGLDTLHLVTSSAAYELVVELIDETGKYGFARYKDFKIAGEAEKYRMSALGEYSGTIGDGLRPHQNSKFSTFDQDNDLREGSCSLDYHSGAAWWYNNCGGSSLNGPYEKNAQGNAIFWLHLGKTSTFSRMMIRRK
uniref:Ficolin-1 n=2 Tax=Culex pipiens TaxID=7175 RepID=A0A8D8AJD7_CULPI